MTETERAFIKQQEEQVRALQTQAQQGQVSQAQQSMILQQQESSLAKEQLDLTEELERIANLLRGRFLDKNKEGEMVWFEATDKSSVFLTEAGIQFILNSITFYLNKNTLLSNFDEETINGKMEDYATSLADLLFMRSDVYFITPTDEEVAEIYEKRLDERVNKRMAVLKIQGEKGNFEEIKRGLLEEVDLEKEFDKLKAQMKNDKLKGFEHVIREIQDSVHSTYNRAWKGGERTSLRKHMHISETKGGIAPQQKSRGINPLNWFKKS